MSYVPGIALAALVILVGLLVRAETRQPRALNWVRILKPAATGLCLAIALAGALSAGAGGSSRAYGVLVAIAIGCGLYGDWQLIDDSDPAFMRGLAAFLVGHVVYVIAMGWAQGQHLVLAPVWLEIVVALALISLGAIVFLSLRGSLGNWAAPVVIYGAVILVMAHRAIVGSYGAGSILSQPALALGGALLFVVSDLMLAIERFVFGGRSNAGVAMVLASYYGAQAMFALSAWHV